MNNFKRTVVQIFVEHWGGIICNFTPILPYFQHWGVNLDQVFFQVSKSSEDKKKVFTRNGTLFSSNSSTGLRSDAHQILIIGEDADEDHIQIVSGIQSNYWGRYIPSIPPGFRHPCIRTQCLLFILAQNLRTN